MWTLVEKLYVFFVIVVYYVASCSASRVVAKSAEGKDALRAKASEVEFSGRHLLTDGANAWYLTLKGNPPRSSSLRISLRGPVSSKSAVPSPSPNPGNPGCLYPSNVGNLCIDPKSTPEQLRQHVAEPDYKKEEVFAVGILLNLGVPYEIGADIVRFNLPSRGKGCQTPATVTEGGVIGKATASGSVSATSSSASATG